MQTHLLDVKTIVIALRQMIDSARIVAQVRFFVGRIATDADPFQTLMLPLCGRSNRGKLTVALWKLDQ